MRATPHGSPLRLGRGRIGPVLKDEFEAEQVREGDEAAERDAGGLCLESGQPLLTDAELGREGFLRQVTSLTADTQDLPDLTGVGDELLLGDLRLGR